MICLRRRSVQLLLFERVLTGVNNIKSRSSNAVADHWKMDSQKILVDGSHGEGGGQIIRNAVTLACILQKELEVVNIRANRPNPGLASQHLESILSMMDITGAKSSRQPKKQDTEFDLDARKIGPFDNRPGLRTTIDLKTAGSCTLSIQGIMPFLMCLKTDSHISVIGGTHVLKSPSYDYFERVSLPIMNKVLGTTITSRLKRPGYYPRGGGCVELDVNTNQGKFTSFALTQRRNMKRVKAILNAPKQMGQDLRDLENKLNTGLEEVLEQNGNGFKNFSFGRDVEVRSSVPYAAVEVIVEFEESIAGFSFLVEGKRPRSDQLFNGIGETIKTLQEFLSSTAAVDSNMQDQLVIYMALAKSGFPNEVSRIRTTKITDHTTSAIHVAQLFFPHFKFAIKDNGDGSFDISL